LDDKHAEEQEVEFPASGFDTDGNEVLVEEETNVGRDVLHQESVGTDVERENLQRIGNVERNPAEMVSFVIMKHR